MHIETLVATATAPGAAGAAAAAVTGDSLVVKNGSGDIDVIAAWAKNQTDGFLQIATPGGHDTTRGFRARINAASLGQIIPMGVPMRVYAQETMSLTIAGSAVAGDVEAACLTLLYDKLPGIHQEGITFAQLSQRIISLTTIEATCAGAAAGYGTSELVTAESDLLRADREYAILGGTVDTLCTGAFLRGPDTGNVRVGFPGDPNQSWITSQWFCVLARAIGKPIIPVIRSGNKAATNLDVHTDENAGNVGVTWLLALLK